MPVPKRKRSRSRRDKRFANKGIKVRAFAACPNCQEVVVPHTVCMACGHYKGVKILVTRSERAEKRNAVRKTRANRTSVQDKQGPSVVAKDTATNKS